MKLRSSKQTAAVISKLDQLDVAKRELEKVDVYQSNRTSRPFDNQVQDVGNSFRETTQKALDAQQYDLVKELLTIKLLNGENKKSQQSFARYFQNS
mmetsp:Transcript_20181/g.47265  ORF Transcript_20181/g.47265 Transcript_20181/m.47265 type:complete len:96 (-) Transcript_20181:16-303(-)